ncbi:MAG: hypothetical protein EOP82_05660 [Variovorax sp.]|nr:MAG: hypothetical protein EOP82_05660 [Variovorax sp.]
MLAMPQPALDPMVTLPASAFPPDADAATLGGEPDIEDASLDPVAEPVTPSSFFIVFNERR